MDDKTPPRLPPKAKSVQQVTLELPQLNARGSLMARVSNLSSFIRLGKTYSQRGTQHAIPASPKEAKFSFNTESSQALDLAMAVRSGNVERVRNIIKDFPQFLEQRCSFVVYLRSKSTNYQLTPVDEQAESYGKAKMKLNLLQLAIVAQHSEIVQLFLNEARKQGISKLVDVFKTGVVIESNLSREFFKYEDLCYIGMNVIHLASKFLPSSLEIMIDYLIELETIFDISPILEAKDECLGITPLHLAAENPNPVATRTLLHLNVNIASKDIRGYTPLHYASRAGNEESVQLLIESGAPVNEKSFADTYGKTPLHRARTPGVVEILLENGADPFVNMTGKGENSKSPFTLFLTRNPTAAELVLDQGVRSYNDMNSSDFMIVFDYQLFHEEILHSHSDDEMVVHKTVVNSGYNYLLEHPLLNTFLHFKWALSRKIFFMELAFYSISTVFLTVMASFQIALTQCKFKNGTEGICLRTTIDCKRNYEDDFSWILINCKHSWPIALFNALMIATMVALLAMVLKELTLLSILRSAYLRKWENLLKTLIMVFGLIYLGFCRTLLGVSRHFASWAVFFSWIHLTSILGRYPKIGVFIAMAYRVTETLGRFIWLFSPVLAAFAFAFHIIHDKTKMFDNPITSFMKIFVMLTGEYELGEYFVFSSVNETRGHGTIQILFVLFVFFVAIVIYNLLVGLSVSQIDEIYRDAGILRLKRIVTQGAITDKVFQKTITCLPGRLRKMLDRRQFIMKTLHFDSTKICIFPNDPKCRRSVSWYQRQPRSFSVKPFQDMDFIAYTCSKEGSKPSPEMALPFKFPGWLVENTLTYLKTRTMKVRLSSNDLLRFHKRSKNSPTDVREITKLLSEIQRRLSTFDTSETSGVH